MTATVQPSWLLDLGAIDIDGADWYLAPESTIGTRHGAAMRVGLAELGLAAYLTVESAPVAAFVECAEGEEARIESLHQALWNQGLATVLVAHFPVETRIYSLVAPPAVALGKGKRPNNDLRLVRSLRNAAEALELSTVVPSILSGRMFDSAPSHFNQESRVDVMLLENLRAATRQLMGSGLRRDSAQALLLQTIFIAYLEERGMVRADHFASAAGDPAVTSLPELLARNSPPAFYRLFQQLHEIFNGDVFLAPCAFDPSSQRERVLARHVEVLRDFQGGRFSMVTGQGWFWPYQFKFIPVELISAIYNRFLADDPDDRRRKGAYYTRSFLADLTLDQAWGQLNTSAVVDDVQVLDPACGSGIFLVRAFQRMIEDWHRKNGIGRKPYWRTLKAMVARLHGWDSAPDAVRIAVFSLYVALLDHAEPKDIGALLRQGKILPPLYGSNLLVRDFFGDDGPSPRRFDLVIGNPPWVSRHGEELATAQSWCQSHDYPMPGKELAWGFLWKSLEHVKSSGVVTLLLPAMGVLLNDSAVAARIKLLNTSKLVRIINFADLRFQLFDGAIRPTALCVFKSLPENVRDYAIDYWCPKATRLLPSARLIALGSVDKAILRRSSLLADHRTLNRYMWSRARDRQLLDFLRDLPSLGSRVVLYGQCHSDTEQVRAAGKWIIGQGFQPFSDNEKDAVRGNAIDPESRRICKLPHLDMEDFHPWATGTPNRRWPTEPLRRKGFVEGFENPRVLIPQGIGGDRLRAAYAEEAFNFRHSLQAISGTVDTSEDLKLLTAIVNSKFAAWFLFHETTNFGSERAKVHEEELLLLPFPSPVDLLDAKAAVVAKQQIVTKLDRFRGALSGQAPLPREIKTLEAEMDALVFDFFGLSDSERVLIDDTLNYIIPSIQPRKNDITPLMRTASQDLLRQYEALIVTELRQRLKQEHDVVARIIDGHPDLAVVELQSVKRGAIGISSAFSQGAGLDKVLDRIFRELPRQVSRNVEPFPDMTIFEDDRVYLVKPVSARHWIGSAALADADRLVVHAESKRR